MSTIEYPRIVVDSQESHRQLGVLCGNVFPTSMAGWEPTSTDEFYPLKCAHVSKIGKRCDDWAIEGDTLCTKHGAAVDTVDLSLQRRLLILKERSLNTAEELLDFADDRVKATLVIAIWDRTGMGPKSTITLDKPQDLSSLTLEQIHAELDRLKRVASDEARRQATMSDIPGGTDSIN